MRSCTSVLVRRVMPTTRYPSSSSNSARYDPSWPVIPVMSAVLATCLPLRLVQDHDVVAAIVEYETRLEHLVAFGPDHFGLNRQAVHELAFVPDDAGVEVLYQRRLIFFERC